MVRFVAHYYIDFPNTPPPFASMMPRCVGYISKGGLEVLYGLKTRGDIQRQLHLDHVPQPDAIQQRIAQLESRPKYQFLLPLGICEICYEMRGMTRHHLTPRQMMAMGWEYTGIVRICRPCHDKVHIHYTNPQLINTHWPDVVDVIREVIHKAQLKREKEVREREANRLRKAKVTFYKQPLTMPLFVAWPTTTQP